MKPKYVIITIALAIVGVALLPEKTPSIENVKPSPKPEAVSDSKPAGELNETHRKVNPEILGITLGTSLGEVLKNPAIETSTQIEPSKSGKRERITYEELSKIYEDAKANLNDLNSVRTFVNKGSTQYNIKVADDYQYLGFGISELQLGIVYSPKVEDFIVDRFGATLKGDFHEISGKISGSLGKMSDLRDPRRELESSTLRWSSIGKEFATVYLDKNCQLEIESDSFQTLIKGQHANQLTALNAGYIKMDLQKIGRESLEKLKAVQRRNEEKQNQKSEHPDTPGGNQ